MNYINDRRITKRPNEDDTNIFPPDKLPQCWHDKTRINALFAPFRLKTVNPEDWVSKLKFWSALIKEWCDIKGCASFTLRELKRVFIENKRAPACLDTVIQEMLNSGEIKTFTAYYEPPQPTWSGWAVNVLVKKPIRWSFDTLKSTILNPPIEENATYVVLENAKKNGDELIKKLNAYHNDIFDKGILSLQTVLECSKKLNLSYDGTMIALHSLYCQNRLALRSIPDKSNANEKVETIVKLAAENESNTTITQVDISIYTLQQNEKYLMDSISALEEKKELLRLEAKKYLDTNKRNLAKNCLKKKRQFDASIGKRMQTLDNIQGLLTRILESQSDGKVLDTYQNGLAALKDTMKELQLNSDVVQDTMTGIQDTLEECDEIQTGLSQLNIEQGDAEELENELKDLLQDASDDDEREEKTKTPPKTAQVNKSVKIPENMKTLYPDLVNSNVIDDEEILENMLSKLPQVPDRLSPKEKKILQQASTSR